ncbi:transmembrane GTPase fzo1 [Desarmillaria tabescens]|uniref:Transmembrane GTPase fzo1 n=1 Tax=Armillaria tabescens TaxID=1929756 RepID=A0AA39NFJ9_ARMTA|nr:transmembrane GTPase fzo1 [Desarmillaria tabescens]KAK0464709.1 transmembrane GTPase fzo1 [Desarmillaria tabescens]
MAQSYFPRVSSPVQEAASFASFSGEKHSKVEDVQEAYIEHKGRLVKAIDETKSILGDIRTFNKEEWVVRYPQLREQDATPPSVSSGRSLRRSLSFADDPTTETDVVLSGARQGMTRSITLASIADAADEEGTCAEEKQDGPERLLPQSEFQVLRLDLKLGAHGSSTSAASLVSQLEKASIANLLDDRITSSLSHIDKLRLRVEDTSSKVLVTGDLNAGKSTFVNALLRREVMPVDQQPCTTAFCEVHDAAENKGVEEVHILIDGITYNIQDESTFTRAKISDLEDVVGENESSEKVLKLYLADTRATIRTTALFARQEEIDVVVFVVSAENHFTLSAKEFLWNASNEKAYLFIVVNKYDQIKNKEKCRRMVLDQIKQLSPRTYEDAEDLVHFVDSAAALQPFTASPSFDDLESSLRSFVLVKRSKSKLNPASTYLVNLLSDIDLLAGANALVADSELQRSREDLAQAKPVLEKMQSSRDALEESLEAVEEQGATQSSNKTKSVLGDALERVGQGRLGVENGSVSMPSYPGLLGIWSYAREVKSALLASIDAAVRLAEDEVRVITSQSVDKIKDLAEEHLPAGVERNKRVFMPEAMFSTVRRAGKGAKHRRASTVVAGGVNGLGIGLAQRPDMLETSFLDLFDVHHQFWLHFGDGKIEDDSAAPTALGLMSVGVGALTMVGGQAIGARGLIEGIIRVTDVFGNETARKWAAPVLGAVTLGLTAYVVMELPNSIPKTVGRRVKASVTRADGEEEDTFIEIQAGRISREARKVLRLASWDLRGRFTGAMEERVKEVKVAEEMEKKASRAKEWFSDVSKRTADVRVLAGLGRDD